MSIIGKIYRRLPHSMKIMVHRISLCVLTGCRIWVWNKIERRYQEWIRSFDSYSERDKNLISQHVQILEYKPKISVVMPVYNAEASFLRRALDSVLEQIYPNWELCIADDASTDSQVRKILQEYKELDDRIKVIFRNENGHIAKASNSALSLVSGDFIALLDQDDEIPDHALYCVAVALNQNPKLDLIYSDEDKIDGKGKRFEPYFKSDWNPDLFYSQNMVSHLGVYRSELVMAIGGFREGYEGSQDYDLALRVLQKTDSSKIYHIPKVLYHWRAVPGSTALNVNAKSYAYQSGRKALKDYFATQGIKVEVTEALECFYRVIYPLPDTIPLVSIICVLDKSEAIWHEALLNLLKNNSYSNVELVLVGKPSEMKPIASDIQNIFHNIHVQLVEAQAAKGKFAAANEAVKFSKGEIFAFLLQPMVAIDDEWLLETIRQVTRDGVGLVGPIIYSAKNLIQGSGLILQGNNIHTYHYGLPNSHPGYYGRARLVQNVTALSSQLMVITRNTFNLMRGFDAGKYPDKLGHIDLALRLSKHHKRNIVSPYSRLIDRAEYNSTQSLTHNAANPEEQCLLQEWAEYFNHDPALNPNLSIDKNTLALAFPPRNIPSQCNARSTMAPAVSGSGI